MYGIKAFHNQWNRNWIKATWLWQNTLLDDWSWEILSDVFIYIKRFWNSYWNCMVMGLSFFSELNWLVEFLTLSYERHFKYIIKSKILLCSLHQWLFPWQFQTNVSFDVFSRKFSGCKTYQVMKIFLITVHYLPLWL